MAERARRGDRMLWSARGEQVPVTVIAVNGQWAIVRAEGYEASDTARLSDLSPMVPNG